MASSSGRDRRPDALSRLRSQPAPWEPEVGVGVGVQADDDRTPPPERMVETAPRDVEPSWGATPPPRWLDDGDGDAVAAQSDRSTPLRRTSPRRMPFVAPPAAIALIAVGVLACVVTAYSVLRGPSDDSPAAARVAFPASAGAAAPSSARPAESGRPAAGGRSPESSSSGARPPSVDELVVSVVGLVRTPGLVRLTGAARVADAIARAGGGRPGADLLSLNMAQPVRDGDQILVGFADPAGGAGMRSAIVSASSSGTGASGPAAPGSGTSATTGAPGSASAADGAPVNLNTADEAALDTLPGVGPVTAKSIIDWRSRNGGFTSVDQLAEVDGIGPGRLAKLRDRVTV
ncbi:ComEA family DNA-binding protein [Williamsia phyllosphaerae]|uniref:Helix-hairpin-helix DNA-binding motif class 1 domain-containing protein n=1 Tax=Williamsia phyllosphaerae TaxID=885042 RepID=A0ABQ1UXY7_9NOCA|nr:ComEA family DNA-binding protein [Williamsia phyllosphaerae]GGF28125.1 hypothetical protein GCM10007298_24900 [Williamsia phyllosphaerae]